MGRPIPCRPIRPERLWEFPSKGRSVTQFAQSGRFNHASVRGARKEGTDVKGVINKNISTMVPSHALGEDINFQTIPASPMGYLHRNGTPRQPLLVPLARSRLRLVSDIPPLALEGLELYSHVWVLYIFHENTDLTKLWQGDRSGIKAKVSVPRLNGGKMGVLATRSPHRPVPIGLSVAQVGVKSQPESKFL